MSTDTRVVYQALATLCARYASHPRPGGAPLTASELRVFSQNGEDGVIEEVMARMGVATGTFVEFGVERGTEGNCVFLADVLGWRGMFMEADPTHHHHLFHKYRHNDRVKVAHTRVTPGNIDALLRDGGMPEDLDVLSIDVDGIDLWIWQAVSAVRARLVVIEYNAHLDPASRLVQPEQPSRSWDGTDYFGASLGALRAVAARRGYRLVHTDLAGVNAFFVRADLAGPFPPEAEVPVRAPNYFLRGEGHPPNEGGVYVTLDA